MFNNKNKNIIIGVSSVTLLGGISYLLLNKFSKKNTSNQVKSQNQQKQQQQNINSKAEQTPQPSENQPLIDITKKEEIIEKPEFTSEQIQKYLQSLNDNLFEGYSLLGSFAKDLAAQMKQFTSIDIKHTLLEQIQQNNDLKVLTSKLSYDSQKMVELQKCHNLLTNIQFKLQRGVEHSLKQQNMNLESQKSINNAIKYYINQNQDENIVSLVEKISLEFDNTLGGKQPTVENCPIPEKLTPQFLLQVKKEIYIESCKNIQQNFRENQNLNHLNEMQLHDFRVQQEIIKLDFTQIKNEIFEKHGILEELNGLPVDKLLAYAAQKYTESHLEFKYRNLKLEKVYNFTFEACIYQNNNEEAISKFLGAFEVDNLQ